MSRRLIEGRFKDGVGKAQGFDGSTVDVPGFCRNPNAAGQEEVAGAIES
jgi:hypothetical protein